MLSVAISTMCIVIVIVDPWKELGQLFITYGYKRPPLVFIITLDNILSSTVTVSICEVNFCKIYIIILIEFYIHLIECILQMTIYHMYHT